MTTAPPGRRVYAPSPGVELVSLPDGDVLLHSDLVSLRVEGGFARILAERIWPHLDGRKRWDDLVPELAELPLDVVRERLDELVRRRALVCHEGEGEPHATPLLALLEASGVGPADALARLDRLHVVVFGLEAHGAHAASTLALAGVGQLTLVDGWPCEPGDLQLLPGLGPEAVGRAREDVVRDHLVRVSKTRVRTSGLPSLTRVAVVELMRGASVVLACFDRGFAAAHYWINEAAIELGVPAVFSSLHGLRAYVGPLVLPGRSACEMCHRMRALACVEDFEVGMAVEERLNALKRPRLHRLATLPALPPIVGGLLASEVLQWLLELRPPLLADTVLELDGFTLGWERHALLRKPDCPVCAKKKTGPVNEREHPDLAELRARTDEPGHLATLIPTLVDPYVGIVRGIERFEKDASEPFLPHVYRGELANHRFLGVETRQHRTFSGKGMSEPAAQTSAVGEAVERYSAGVWAPEELRYCRRSELDERSIDPVDLVLFRPEQYPGLHYRPYTGDNRLGWIRGRSLSQGDVVWVPAIAVLMSYSPVLTEEYLFQTTSNGLAAGPTLAHAILSAALEVVERDAFLLTWLARLPVRRVPAAGHPDPDVRTIVETHARRGVAIELYRLDVGHPVPAFAAAAIEEGSDASGPAAVFGMGAAYDAADAARQAIIEVAQIRPALRRRMRTPEGRERLARLAVDPHAVATIEDHDLRYASQHALPALSFLRGAPEVAPPWHDGPTHGDPAVQLARLCDDLAAGPHAELVYVNLTSPELAALGLYTARAVIPGMQPIDFGWPERRLGGARLRELPAALGLRAGPLELDAINDAPHPIA